MRNKTVVLVAMAATVLATGVLTGCDAEPSAEPGTSAASTSTAAAPAPADSVPTDAQPKHGEASTGAGLTVSGVRIGSQAGFDRVVYDLGGSGMPGWVVRYTERAVQDGSGRELEVAGDSVLEVRITGSAYPFDSGVSPYAGPDPATDPAVPGIAGVSSPLVFEGISQSFIGVAGERPAFSVTALSNPTRLIVDIATAG